MSAEVDIYNFALSRVKVSQRVSNLTEASEPRRVCSLWYAQCRDAVLRDFPWPFATKTMELALLDETSPGWAYVYQYPSDCVFARKIMSEDGNRLPSVWTTWFQECSNLIQAKIPFSTALSADGGSQTIVTDLNEAWLAYTSRVAVTTVFPADFVDALAWRLAMEIALPLGAKDMDKNAAIQYRASISAAWARALNESAPDQKPDSPSIACR